MSSRGGPGGSPADGEDKAIAVTLQWRHRRPLPALLYRVPPLRHGPTH